MLSGPSAPATSSISRRMPVRSLWPLVIGRHVGRDVDDVASRLAPRARCEKRWFASVGRQQFRQTRLDDRQRSALECGDQRARRDRNRSSRKPLAAIAVAETMPEMRHAGKTDDVGRLILRRPCARRRSVPLESQIDCSDRSASGRAQSFLKCSYSSAQVGSSCVSVIVVSGGRPLGSTRRRCVNVVGPHLHRRSNVGGAAFGKDVAGEMIAPHAQRHFKLDARPLVVSRQR